MPAGVVQLVTALDLVGRFFTIAEATIVELAPESTNIFMVFISVFGSCGRLACSRPKSTGCNGPPSGVS